MEYTNEQFFKLPKWAQLEITRLKNNNESLSKKLDQINGDAETNTYLIDGMDKKPLPSNSQIEFRTPDSGKVSIYVRSDGEIDVNTNTPHGKQMVILPSATNSFYISFK